MEKFHTAPLALFLRFRANIRLCPFHTSILCRQQKGAFFSIAVVLHRQQKGALSEK